MDDDRLDPRAAERVRALKAICTLPLTQVHGSLEGRVEGGGKVALEPDGRHAAVVLPDAIERWELDTIECVGRWEARAPTYHGSVFCVGESPAGLRLADRRGLWRPTSGADAWQEMISFQAYVAIAVPPDVLLAREAASLRAIDVASGVTLWRVGAWTHTEYDSAFARGGRSFLHRVSATSFNVVELVDASPDGAEPPLEARVEERVVARLATRSPARWRAGAFGALHGGARIAAIATEEGVLLGRWDDWWSAALLPGTDRHVVAMEFTHDGRTLVIVQERGFMRVDVATGDVCVARGGHPFAWSWVAASTSSGRLLQVPYGALSVLDEGSTTFRTRAHDPIGTIHCAVGTRDGRALVTGADDGSLRVRDRVTGVVLAQVEVGELFDGVVVSPDDRELIAVTPSGAVWRHDRETGDLLGHVDAGAGPQERASGDLVALTRAPDGRHLALLFERSDLSEVTFVDLATGARRRVLVTSEEEPHGGRAIGLSFLAPDRLRVARQSNNSLDEDDAFCFECALGGGAPRLLLRWPLPEEVDGRAPASHDLSRDGRLLWRMGSGPGTGNYVVARSVDGGDERRWAFGGGGVAPCAGNSLLALSNGRDTLWLFSATGASVQTAWPGPCALLAFAPDDRALWVRDASGLVVELAVPASLFERP